MKKIALISMVISLLVVACGSKATPTPIPTVELNAPSQTTPTGTTHSNGGVSASGKVVAEKEAHLGFILGGNLKDVNVSVGDPVKTGQVLGSLENNAYQLDYDQAVRNLNELTSPAAQAAAAQALAAAQQSLHDQQDKVDSQSFKRASDTLIQNTQAEIDLAKQALARASDAYRQVSRLEDGNPQKAAALVAMTNAQLRLNNLTATLNWYTGKPTDIDAALESAKLDVSKAAVQEAQWYLSAVKGDNIPAEATGTDLMRLKAAKDIVTTAKDRLDHTQIISPIPGVIINVNAIAGEFITPGQVIFVISDVTQLHIETTDLSERDLPGVKVGQKVMITVKALNTTLPGHVTSISPVADLLGGDVVYKTRIDIDSTPDQLRAGMSVDVEYESGS